VPALPPRALPPRPRPPPPPFPRVPEPKAQAHPRSRSLCRCCPSSPHPAFPRRRPPARQAQAQEDRSGKTSSLLFRSHPHIPHLRRHYPRRWPRCNGQQRGCPPGLDGRRTALLKQRAGGVAERSIASVLKSDEGASPPWVRIPPPPPILYRKLLKLKHYSCLARRASPASSPSIAEMCRIHHVHVQQVEVLTQRGSGRR